MRFLQFFTNRYLVLLYISAALLTDAKAQTKLQTVEKVFETSITLVGEDDWFPYAANRNGKLKGFAVDVIEAAYAAMHVTVEFKAAPYARCLMLVETGQELACFDSLKDGELSPRFVFHEVPIFKAEIGIYALASSTEHGLTAQGMRGKKVGVTHAYTYTDKIDKEASIVREEAPSDLSNLRKLLLNRSQYSLVYTKVVDHLIQENPKEFLGKIKQVGTIKNDNLYVSFSKKRAEAEKYARLLDQGLRKIKANGTYAKIERDWQSPAP